MSEWQPIETAPKTNERPLFIARFNDDGSMQSFDYNTFWQSESESWEIPQVYYFWASENGNVEEPTHWMYQPEGFSQIAPISGITPELSRRAAANTTPDHAEKRCRLE